MSAPIPRILYCHCQYAQVVPKEVKEAVLRQLCEAEAPFEAVADLCELSARKDPSMRRLAAEGPVKIAACFPRAVKWLFHQAGASLDPASTEVLNMRTQSAQEVVARLAASDLRANVPAGKETAPLVVEQAEESGDTAASTGAPLQTEPQPTLA